MLMASGGKHEGKSCEKVVLTDPDYVLWYIGNHPTARAGIEFARLIDAFDRKPFVAECYTCKRQATRASVYQQNFDFMFWCDNCNPYGSGARSGTLTVVKTYREAIWHINSSCGGRKSWKGETIKHLARGKGLPKRITDAAASAFFT